VNFEEKCIEPHYSSRVNGYTLKIFKKTPSLFELLRWGDWNQIFEIYFLCLYVDAGEIGKQKIVFLFEMAAPLPRKNAYGS
jgi:hypothetical protein